MSETQKDLSKIGPSEGVNIDLGKYDKQEVKIEVAEVMQVPSTFTPLIVKDNVETTEHQKQWVLKIASTVLESFGEGEDIVEFRASELFNLIQDKKTGELTGFPTGDGSNLYKFLSDLRIDIPTLKSLKDVADAVKGKPILVKAYDKVVSGNKKTYLRFRY